MRSEQATLPEFPGVDQAGSSGILSFWGFMEAALHRHG